MPSRTTLTSYGPRCQRPESVTNALGQSSATVYNYNLVLPASQTDPNGITFSWLYDNYGRNVQEIRPDGTSTTRAFWFCDALNTYCGTPDLRWGVTQAEQNTVSGWTTYKYIYNDGFDRQRFDARRNLSSTLTYTFKGYDALGRTAYEVAPMLSSGSWRFHTFTYDLMGRLTKDALYQPGGVLDRQTTIGYEGRTAVVTDPKNNVSYKFSDVSGKLRQVTDPTGGISYYTWDFFGNLTSTTDPIGAVSSTAYDLLGHVTSTTDADRGTWTYKSNSLGELIHVRDAKTSSPNWTMTNSYDSLGRLLTRAESEGTSTWTWGSNPLLHNIGKLSAVSGPGGYSESYTFDSIGRPAQTTYVSDASYIVNYEYDSVTGFLDKVTYPESTSSYRLSVRRCYTNGILSSVKDGAHTCAGTGGTIWWQLLTQDTWGNPIDESLGNGVHVISENDALTGHLNWRTSGTNGQFNNHQNITYYWDKNENLTSRVDVNQSNLTESFAYDGLDRLMNSTLTGVSGYNLQVTLNAAGNITSKTGEGPNNVGSYTYDSTKKHAVLSAGGNTYTYDANGNMATRNGVPTSWYSYNLPNSIDNGASQFFYGPDRNRWKQVATYSGGTETTIYVGGLMEKVTVAGGTAYRHYIPAGSNKVVYTRWSTGSNLTYYVTGDHLSSSNTITDSAGGIVVNESFGAYGHRRGSNWKGSPSAGDMSAIANTTRHGFTGHEHLDNLGLIHMNGRVFDPVIGRFMSADPFVPYPDSSQSWNRFAYVQNRALSATDPTGFIDGMVVERPRCGWITSDIYVPCDGGSITIIDWPDRHRDTYQDPFYSPTGGQIYMPPPPPPEVTQGNVIWTFQTRGKCPKPNPAEFGRAVFLNSQFDAASLVSEKFDIDTALLLGVAAKESGWGTSSMYRDQNNPFGATPKGDATPGISYNSYYSAWNSWGKQWGPRLQSVGPDISGFVTRLLYDNRKLGPAIDHRGSYNSEDRAYSRNLTNTIKSVQKRLDDALKAFSPECSQ